jgi:hypothetical protein
MGHESGHDFTIPEGNGYTETQEQIKAKKTACLDACDATLAADTQLRIERYRAEGHTFPPSPTVTRDVDMGDGRTLDQGAIAATRNKCRSGCMKTHGTAGEIEVYGLFKTAMTNIAPSLEAADKNIRECLEKYLKAQEQLQQLINEFFGQTSDFQFLDGHWNAKAVISDSATVSGRAEWASRQSTERTTIHAVGGLSSAELNSYIAKIVLRGGGTAQFEATSDYTKWIDANIPLGSGVGGDIALVFNNPTRDFTKDPLVKDDAAELSKVQSGTRTMNIQFIDSTSKFQELLLLSEIGFSKSGGGGNVFQVDGVGLEGTETQVKGWPYGWFSWVTNMALLAKQLIEIGPAQEDLDKMKSNIPGAYSQATSGIIGDGGNKQDAPYDEAFFASPMGILTYGSARYWPKNSQNLVYKSSITAKMYIGGDLSKPVGATKSRERLLSATTGSGTGHTIEPQRNMSGVIPADQSGIGLQNQNIAWMVDYANTLADNIEKLPNVIAETPRRELAQYIRTFGSKLKLITNEMLDAASCIFAEDWDSDAKINEELAKITDNAKRNVIQKLLGLKEGREKAMMAAVNALRKKAALVTPLLEGANPERILFKEQCFLLSFIGIISDYKKRTLNFGEYTAGKTGFGAKGGYTGTSAGHGHPAGNHKRLPYKNPANYAADPSNPLSSKLTNATLLVDGDPYGFMNQLTVSPYTTRLLNIENWELSNLQPRIRLFKVIYDGKDEKEVEIKFDSHFSKQEMNMFLDKNSRGGGIGLKSFNFTYDGSNPFAAKKSIKGQLNLFANSFSELLQDRVGATNDTPPGKATYKYIELALKTGKPYKGKQCTPPQDYIDMMEQNEELSKLNFRLKAVVGWSAPHGLSGMRQDDKIQLQRALDDSFVTLNLTPTVHNFDFDEQGRVNFTINYLAYIEDFFDQKGYNIFADPSGKIGLNRIKRDLSMKTFQRECGGTAPSAPPQVAPGKEGEEKEAKPTAQDSLETIKAAYADEVRNDTLESVSKLLFTMACSNSIYYINIPYSKIRMFVQKGPFQDYSKYHEAYRKGNFILNDEAYGSVLATQISAALNSKKAGQAGYYKASGGKDLSGTDEGNQVAGALVSVNPNANNLPFFYVSDLLDQVLGNIELELDELSNKLGNFDSLSWKQHTTKCDVTQRKNELELYLKNFKRFRLLLGPVEFVHHKVDKGAPSAFVNFGDIPISVKYFVEWLTSKVLQREETSYPLTKFLNDFFNTLVRDFLNNDSCFIYNTSQKVRVNQAVLTSFRPDKYGKLDDITYKIGQKLGANASRINLAHFDRAVTHKIEKGAPVCLASNKQRPMDSMLPILNVSGIKGSSQTYAPLSREMNFFVFFAGRTMPTEMMNGHKCQDEDRGIQHYLMGRDKGLLKTIKLTKTDSKGLAEVRFEQDGYDGLRQLRVVYDVEIDSFANVQTYPGTYIYIPPRGFDPGMLPKDSPKGFDMTDLGIGGYYMVIRSEHEFGEGYANSKIHAKWVAQIDKDNKPGVATDSSMRASPGKCKIYAQRAAVAKKGTE